MPRNGGGGGTETPRSKPQSPLRISHDSEFYARLLSKESSGGNPSFRYYYGAGPGAVPFGWESHPGTPKDADDYSSSAAVVPAITPPPSYHFRAAAATGPHGSRRCHGGCKINKWVTIGFIATVLRRLAFGKPATSSSSVPAVASVKTSSSSTRWLFASSGGAAGARDLREGCYEPPTTANKGMLCLGGIRTSPWMVQLWGGAQR